MGTLELASNCIHVCLSELVHGGVHRGGRRARCDSDINGEKGGGAGGLLGLSGGFEVEADIGWPHGGIFRE